MTDLLHNDSWLLSPWAWALVTAALALWCLTPKGRVQRWQTALGGVLGVVSMGLFASRLPGIAPLGQAAIFWLLAAITVVSAAAMISMRSPIYSAIWFALTLLGTACLLLLQGAELLAVATVAVYAGAIVVMFLFLIMLAQPEGHEYYDRISWSSAATLFSAIAGAAIVLMLTVAVVHMGEDQSQMHAKVAELLSQVVDDEEQPVWTTADIRSVRVNQTEANLPQITVRLKQGADEQHVAQLQDRLSELDQFAEAAPMENQIKIEIDDPHGTIAEAHVATLGGVLFSEYLVAVEVAGALLLVALVGAVAIVMHGRVQERRAAGIPDASPPAESAGEGGR